MREKVIKNSVLELPDICNCEGRRPVAIPYLSLEELIYFDTKREKDKTEEVRDIGGNKNKLQSNGKEEQK
jgi:hypothetical protein